LGTDRLLKLRQEMERQNLDALLVSHGANRRYLSRFSGSDGWLIISSLNAYLAIDFRYIEQAKKETDGFEILHIKGDVIDWLPEFINDLGLRNIGFESHELSYSIAQQLSGKFRNGNKFSTLVPVSNIVESLRSIKEPEELELIMQASKLADASLEFVRSILKPGITEKNIAWELEKWLRENGSEAVPFDIIVASGPNSALPHASPSARTINPGEPIVIDFGARVNGYCCDITRSFCLGMNDKTFTRIYDIVLSAQLTGISLIKSGMTGEQADRLSRVVIDQAGYQQSFGHGLGHGVGLVIHESPAVRPKSQDVLSDGMVFTIEPGVYLTDWGGIRIEDTVTLQKGKIVSLTKADK
jgi:Xaa-Pro aminopeptidase